MFQPEIVASECVLNPHHPRTPFPSMRLCRGFLLLLLLQHQRAQREGSSRPPLQTSALCLTGLPCSHRLFSVTELLEEIQHEKPCSLPPSWLSHRAQRGVCLLRRHTGRALNRCIQSFCFYVQSK